MVSTDEYKKFLPWENSYKGVATGSGPDDRSGLVYLHDSNLQLATEIAIVTQRPLLIRGHPGSGKSSFAPFAARNLKWRYYETTITGRTEAKDLLWKFDALARLRDAQAQSGVHDVSASRYVTPGILWWAFNRDDAIKFLSQRKTLSKCGLIASGTEEPFAEDNIKRDPDRAVVLIDEIDKADPEMPNDLLEVFGLNRFKVDELDRLVTRKIPKPDPNQDSANHFGSLLVIITTNQERELPAAFMRRCVVHTIEEPKKTEEQIERFKRIAQLHMGDLIRSRNEGKKLVGSVADTFCKLREQAKQNLDREPSTAEFLDALRVCFRLGINPDSELWKQVERSVVIKKPKS
jgi:MoxR-like ATPase